MTIRQLSLKEYINSTFSNSFWSVGEAYKSNLNTNSYKLHSIGEVTLEDVAIQALWVTKFQDSNILYMDIAIDVAYYIEDGDHHYDNYDLKHQWLLCECKASLDKDLKDFEILTTSEYIQSEKHKSIIADDFSPNMKKVDLDDQATAFLEKYYPEALTITKSEQKPTVVDPTELARNMGLDVEYKTIKEDGSIFGRIYFDEKKIVVDPKNFYLRNIGSLNNTIVHECVHYHFHKNVFKLAKLSNEDEDITCISCATSGDDDAIEFKTSGKIEWQANQLAPRILMPKAPFESKANDYITKHTRKLVAKYPDRAIHRCDVMEDVIKNLAQDFGVSLQACKIRLIELGFKDAIGTFNYVDGHYVRPYSFKSDAIELNQTFTISFWDACYQSMIDEDLKAKLNEGRYVFVENHFVFNTPLYVEKGKLTDYARSHMDECCLAFNLKVEGKKIDQILFSVCYLNKEGSNVEVKPNYNVEFKNIIPQKQIVVSNETIADETNIYKQMTNDSTQCLKILMKWRNVTIDELAWDSGLNRDTIGDILHGRQEPNMATVVLLCMGLYLPLQISMRLLEVFGVPLNLSNPSHLTVYKYLQFRYEGGVEDLVEELKKCNVELNSRKKIKNIEN